MERENSELKHVEGNNKKRKKKKETKEPTEELRRITECTRGAQIGQLEEDAAVERRENGLNRPTYPFSVDDTDHCESPKQAYADIAPLLTQLCKLLGKSPATLRIWDPYYCNGAVKT